jgi:WD40-like Beta Propeller Repeat.
VATAYDAEAGHGLIHVYDLTIPGPPSETYALPDGTFVHGPLHWSPDGRYVAFVAYVGDPASPQRAEGIWVLRPKR